MASATDRTKPVRDNAIEAAPLRISDWLWRPWYARLWWAAAALFWASVIIVSIVQPTFIRDLDSSYEALIFPFHPFLMVPVLGFGFVRAWVGRCAMEGADDVGGDNLDKDRPYAHSGKLFGWTMTDPAAGSLDPEHIGDPTNPLSAAWLGNHMQPPS